MTGKRFIFQAARRNYSIDKIISFRSMPFMCFAILLYLLLTPFAEAQDSSVKGKNDSDISNTKLIQNLNELEASVAGIQNEQSQLSHHVDEISKGLVAQRIDRLERMTENIYVSLIENVGLTVAVVGSLFIIINFILSAIVWRVYKAGRELSKDFQNAKESLDGMLSRVNKLHEENDALMHRSSIVQKELSRTVWLRYGKLPEELERKIPEDIKAVLIDFLEYINHIDNYRWAILNSMSPFAELRVHALHTIATKLQQIPIAREYLERLYDVYQGPGYETERKLLKIALGRGKS